MNVGIIRKVILGGLALVCAAGVGLVAQPANAITGGVVDTVHTNVGVVRFTTVDGRFRCSGTLISPTVVLTAGQCTEGPATNVLVSFDDALEPDPLAPGITDRGEGGPRGELPERHRHPDPGWTGKLSFSKQHDQRVVVLDVPATTKWPDIKPAPLLPVGTLDANQGALKNQPFTLVATAWTSATRSSRLWFRSAG